MKATNLTVDRTFLAARRLRAGNYPTARWIQFCEAMLDAGYTVELYEARQTYSKYLTVYCCGRRFKVRFSNHRPAKQREVAGDCDFFVGVTHLGVTTTEQAIAATVAALGPSPFAAATRQRVVKGVPHFFSPPLPDTKESQR